MYTPDYARTPNINLAQTNPKGNNVVMERRHRRRFRTRLVIILAITALVISAIDFVVAAFQSPAVLGTYSDPISGVVLHEDADGNTGRAKAAADKRMQLDASVALLALGVWLGSSKLPRRRKRLVFGAVVVVLTPIVVTAVLFYLPSFHSTDNKYERKEPNRHSH